MNDKPTYWDVGASNDMPFRLGKDRCQRLLFALLACRGRITDCYSLDIPWHGTPEMKPHECAAEFRVCLPEDQVERFASLAGCTLTAPPVIQANKGTAMSGEDEK